MSYSVPNIMVLFSPVIVLFTTMRILPSGYTIAMYDELSEFFEPYANAGAVVFGAYSGGIVAHAYGSAP